MNWFEHQEEICSTPCPACHGFELDVERFGDEQPGPYRVVCYVCGVTGPMASTQQDAVAEWKRVFFWVGNN